MKLSARLDAVIKAAVLVAALVPFGGLLAGAVLDRLGANPVETLVRSSGDWALRFLCLTLAIRPLSQWVPGAAWLMRLRRMLGLCTFFYASCHACAYATWDMGWDPAALARDLAQRPFILVGALTLLSLIPLAATSWDGAIRRLGARQWKRLHRLVYLTALLAIVHFYWMRLGKQNTAEVGVYALVLGLLLGWRLWRIRVRPPL